MTVYVLFHETNSGHSEESDGYVEAVYATEADAEAARMVAIRAAIEAGYACYFNPDTEEEHEQWEHDWHVEPHTVRESPGLPADGFFDFIEADPNNCAECARAHGPHYTGPCAH